MLSRENDGDTHGVLTASEPRPNLALARETAGGKGLVARDRRPGAPHPEETKPDHTVVDSRNIRRNEAVLGHPTVAAIGSIICALAVVSGYIYWDFASRFESTDDAFVASRQFAVSPQVSGYITAVPVTDNQYVVAGEVIARIDDRNYRIALEQAEAQVASMEATVLNVDAQLTVQEAQVIASQAQLERAQAALVFAQQQAERYKTLATRQAGSVQNEQQYISGLMQQEAAVRNAQATLLVGQRQIESLKAQRSSAEANLAHARAQRDQAQLNLSFTTVIAAQSGTVVNLTAAAGQLAQADTNLTMFVPDEMWVTANYKETQLGEMRPGQPVIMRIDAYPVRIVRGHVDSIQPGSGTVFSLLPAQNATGNYVKIVQRVPVKLLIDDPPNDLALGPGMSVVPSVRVRPELSLYERLMAGR